MHYNFFNNGSCFNTNTNDNHSKYKLHFFSNIYPFLPSFHCHSSLTTTYSHYHFRLYDCQYRNVFNFDLIFFVTPNLYSFKDPKQGPSYKLHFYILQPFRDGTQFESFSNFTIIIYFGS